MARLWNVATSMIAANVDTSGTAQAVAIAVAARGCPTAAAAPRGRALGELRAARGEQQGGPGDDPEHGVRVLENRWIGTVTAADRNDRQQQHRTGRQQADDDALAIGGLPCIGIGNAKAEDLVLVVQRLVDVVEQRLVHVPGRTSLSLSLSTVSRWVMCLPSPSPWPRSHRAWRGQQDALSLFDLRWILRPDAATMQPRSRLRRPRLPV